MSSLREQITKLVHNYISAFNTNTLEGIIAYRTPDCRHRIIPKSAKMSVYSNAEYQAFIGQGLSVMKNFQLRLDEDVPLIIDEEARRVVFYMHSTAETPIGPYVNEYFFTFLTTDDGTEIKEIIEFIDTKETLGFTEKLMKWLSENAGQEAKAAE